MNVEVLYQPSHSVVKVGLNCEAMRLFCPGYFHDFPNKRPMLTQVEGRRRFVERFS
jgi:hypothetical protein